MPDQPKKFYLTTPIYYVNARPHIGHAYTTIVADVLARRHRLLGPPTAPGELPATFFLTGTDEHGQKIERSALAAGIPPQQFTDQVSAQFRTLWDRMGLTYTDYIRTTEPRHQRGVQQLFRTLYDNGFIYLDKYTGAYCVSDEAFVDQPIGTPCPDCGRPLEEVTEENFFFRLSAFQEKLLNLIESNELTIEPTTARNEVLSFLRGDYSDVLKEHFDKFVAERDRNNLEGNTDLSHALAWGRREGRIAMTRQGLAPYKVGALKDLSISRSSFTWGIPVPDDILERAGATQKHVVYVWLDALANYMTAIGYGSDHPADVAKFEKYWPADLHLVGKEITRFHCVYWPAFLMAAGLPTPKRITANGWLLFDNAKMSKSRGNVVRTETILDAFGTLCPPVLEGSSSGLQPAENAPATKGALAPGFQEPTRHDRDLFAADVLRYFLLREIPFGQDGSFSFDAMVTRYNADLANGYGNLVGRVLSMIEKYLSSIVPKPPSPPRLVDMPVEFLVGIPLGVTQQGTQFFADGILRYASLAESEISLSPEKLKYYLELIGAMVASADSYLTSHRPWKIEEGETGKLLKAEILYAAAEAIRIITVLLNPIMPYATTRVWQQLGLDPAELTTYNVQRTTLLTWGQLKPGTKLGPLSPIFPRADKGLADIMIDMENPTPQQDPKDSSHPAAAPRALDSLAEPSGALPVAGSTAQTTRTEPAPTHATHVEAEPSGIFAATPATTPPSPTPNNQQPTTPFISIDDFAKIELRIAEIKLAERIPKADKLLRLEVSLGTRPDGTEETRQILSGIAEWYTPEDLIGRRIIVITNLAPRKMRGLESHGMLLAASEAPGPENPAGGKPFLATVPEGVPIGTRLK